MRPVIVVFLVFLISCGSRQASSRFSVIDCQKIVALWGLEVGVCVYHRDSGPTAQTEPTPATPDATTEGTP